MSADERSLSDLRGQIDEIDNQCHDLLMERTLVVRQIAQAKSREMKSGAGSPVLAMRPGREGQVLRRLLARHHGALPPGVVARMWRELMAAKTRLQGPLSVSVYGGQSALKVWDLARFHYGAATPMEMAASAQEVLEAVGAEPGRIGVLPAPGVPDQRAPWWPVLCEKNTALRVVAALPFLTDAEDDRDRPQALTIACLTAEPSGDDRTLVAVTFDNAPAVPSVVDRLAKAGLHDVVIMDKDSETYLASVSGFFTDDAEQIANLSEAAPESIRHISVLGAYACPIKAEVEEQVS